MNWSLNEIESLARKAARGSGLSWGLADEAGKSTRWLAAAGLPGATVLAALLTRNDGVAYKALCPQSTIGTWAAKDGPLCPLITGALICDHAANIAGGDTIQLGHTLYPLLLLPYVAAAAALSGDTIAISWPGVTATLGRVSHLDATGTDALERPLAETVHIGLATATSGTRLNHVMRGNIALHDTEILNKFAHRTYAPDTAESRLSGAGAGLSDND